MNHKHKEMGARTSQESSGPASHPTGHENHCFIIMPHGRDPDECRWFKDWYEVVIKPAVLEAGYLPILATAEESFLCC